jgi:thymidylate kinase
MSVKIQPEVNMNRRRKKKRKRRRKKIEKKPSLFERLHEKYKKRKWLVRTVFITKCITSLTLIILEFAL